MDKRVRALLSQVERRTPAQDIDALLRVASRQRVDLPAGYVELMTVSDGGVTP